MNNRITFITSLLLLCISGFSQEINFDKLNNYLDTLEKHNKFMGSIAVSKDGEVIYQKAVGYCSVEDDLKPDKNSIYRIGSISKTFTTVLVFNAVEEGKLKLDETLDVYFPKIKNAKKITIDNLLNHRSGIHNFTNDETYLDWSAEAKTQEELLQIIKDGGSDFEPDSKADYSNSNFLLLSFILEEIYDQSYGELLKEKIVQPLKLENTYYGNKINPIKEHECYSYQYAGQWDKSTETHMSVPSGAGAIVSTPTDLVTFSDALFGGQLVSEEHLKNMMDIKENYGRGLFVFPFYGRKGYGHTGGIDAFSSSLSHFEEDNVSYALISNGSNFDNNQISIAVLSTIYGRAFEIPTFKSISLTEEQLKKYTGEYTSETFPLNIQVSIKNNTLFAQGDGQPAFPLDATDKNEFSFAQAGVVITFDSQNNSMVLEQGGAEHSFKRKKK